MTASATNILIGVFTALIFLVVFAGMMIMASKLLKRIGVIQKPVRKKIAMSKKRFALNAVLTVIATLLIAYGMFVMILVGLDPFVLLFMLPATAILFYVFGRGQNPRQ